MATVEVAAVEGPLAPARPVRAYLALLAGVLCIGFTAIFTKWAGVPGPAAAAIRMAVASVVMAGPFAWRARRRGGPAKADAGLAMLGGLWVGANLGLLNSALLLTSAATATLLDNMAPVWVGVGAMLLLHERLRPRYWAGLALALAGAAVVTGFSPAAARSINQGDLMAFLGSTLYAGYLLITQRARRRLDALSCLWIAVTTAAVGLALSCVVLRIPLLGYSARSYWALFGAGVVSQTGGWLLINYALGYLPASTAVVILLGQPVVTGLLAIPLLGESLALRQVLGGALVLTGINQCVRQNSQNSAAPGVIGAAPGEGVSG